MIGTSIGRYQIRSEIGRGGMAVVYLADDPVFRRQVAIKILPQQFLQNDVLRVRFEREARTIATIEHPAIVPVYDFGEQDGQLYLVMRYMPGGSLSEKIKKGALSPAEAIEIITRLAPALDAVHARGIVHRDLKPGNILFDAFGNPALSDFGIAQLIDVTMDLTGDGVIGTPSYMSPEQVRSDEEIDGRSDIYALGVILYEMLTGRQPYRAATPMSVAMKHLNDPIPQIHPLLPQFPREVDETIEKAMAKERDKRYMHASDLVADLRALPEMPSISIDSTEVYEPTPPQMGAALPVESELASASTAPPPNLAGAVSSTSSVPAGPIKPVHPPVGAPTGAPAATKPRPAQSVGRAWWIPVGAGGLLLLGGLCVLIVLGVLAWQSGMIPGLGQAATPVASATQTGPAAAQESPAATAAQQEVQATLALEEILFSDDFSSPANGWPSGALNGVEYRYDQGGYHMAIDQPDELFWATPDGRYTDSRTSVDATLAFGGGASYFGLLCRLQDQNNFYYLVVRQDGYFTIGKFKDGQFISLMPVGWTFNAGLEDAAQPFHLRADCIDDRLGLYLGDVKLGEAQDGDFEAGKVGVAAAAIGQNESLEILFDQFVVRQPR